MKIPPLNRFATVGLGLCVASALGSSSALAFEPIPPAAVRGLIGKTVYAGANKRLDGKTAAYAGEPLTLVAAEPYGDQSKGERYNFATVRNAEGVEGKVQILYLSLRPLKYNLRKPGKAALLIKRVLADGFPLAQQMHKIRGKHRYDLRSQESQADYDRVHSLDEAFKFASNLVHNLVYGSNRSKDDLMRNPLTRWLAMANDDALLEWYSRGIKNPAQKRRYKNAKDAFSRLANVSSHGFAIARLEREKSDRPWRRGLEGLPKKKVDRMEKQKLTDIARRIKDRNKKIKEALRGAAQAKRKVG